MLFVFLLVFVFVLAGSIKIEHNLYNPCFIFTAIWTLVIFLASLRLFELNEVSDYTYVIVFVGVLCFSLGCLLREIFKISVFHNNSRVVETNFNYDYEVNYTVLVPFYAVVLIFTAYLAMISIGLLMSGTTFETIRFNYDNIESGLVISSGIAYRFEMYVVQAAEFAAVALLPIVMVDGQKNGKKILLTELVLFLVLHLFVTGARSFLIDVVMACVFFYLMNQSIRRRFAEYYKKIPKFIIAVVVIGAILLVVFATNLRKGEGNLIREIYRYFAISLPLLQTHIELGDAHTWGWTLLYGILRPPFSLLHSLGVPFPEGMDDAMQLINANNDFYYVGGGKANSFVTTFYYFYMDFGYVGIPVLPLIYGYFSQSVYARLQKVPNIKNQSIYILVAIGLFLSFVRCFFTAYRYVYAFLILIFVAFRRNKPGQSR